jgi:hypothetical protein
LFSDPFRAFERLGLFVMSDKLIINTECDSLIDVDVSSSNREGGSGGGGAIPSEINHEYQSQSFSSSSDYDGGAPESMVAFDAPPQAAQAFLSSAGPPQQQGFAPLSTRIGGDDNNRVLHKASSTDRRHQVVKKNKIELRNFFPETWLFDLVDLDDAGEHKLDLVAPHTITTWVAEVICSSEEEGMTVSNKTNVVVTQERNLSTNSIWRLNL